MDVTDNIAVRVFIHFTKLIICLSDILQKSVGNVIWKLIFGVDLEFDNEVVPKFRRMQQEVGKLEPQFNSIS